MRNSIFVVSFIILLIFSVFSENARSQNMGMERLADDLAGSDILPEMPAEKNIFAKADDEQIKEAQNFYQSCRENETMSKRKDCKCAAAAFLDTRIRLGNEASIQEIIKENFNVCLLDENIDKLSNAKEIDLKKVSKQQQEEAEYVFNSCKANNDLSNQIDCECLAAEFLDSRMKEGPLAPQGHLIAQITQRKCRNVVETTGLAFQACMRGTAFNYNGIRPKDYCECYARTWGKLFKDYNGRINPQKKSNLRFKARMICKKPESYEKK